MIRNEKIRKLNFVRQACDYYIQFSRKKEEKTTNTYVQKRETLHILSNLKIKC